MPVTGNRPQGARRRQGTELVPVESGALTQLLGACRESLRTRRNDALRVPGPMAIAHHLINAWISGDVSL